MKKNNSHYYRAVTHFFSTHQLRSRIKESKNRKVIILLIVSTLISLSLAEVGTKILFKEDNVSKCLQLDAVTHHSFRPNTSCTYIHPDQGRVVLKTNSLGLKSPEIRIPKPKKTFRILMLGDSFTEGYGVVAKNTFSNQLQNLLQNQYLDHKIEVINAGMRGYSPILEYLFLKKKGLKLEPDLVIVNVDATDVTDEAAYYRVAQFEDSGQIIRVSDRTGKVPLTHKLHFFASRYSLFYKKISNMLITIFHSFITTSSESSQPRLGYFEEDVLVALRENVNVDYDVLWHLPKKSLNLIHSLTQKQQIPLIITVYPYGIQVNGDEWPGRTQNHFQLNKIYPVKNMETIQSFAQQQNIPFINMLNSFRNADTSPLFFRLDGHFTLYGHSVFSQTLFEYLQKNSDELDLPDQP
jgi:lysophospholipase L1-like esterase